MIAATLFPPAASAPGPLVSGTSLRLRFILPAIALLFMLASLVAVRTNDVAHGFDELAHVSYIAELQAADGPVRLERLRMIDPATFGFTARSNYINHPPAYYRAMAFVGPRLEGNPGALPWHRLINVVLIAAALGLFLAAGLALARSIDEALIIVVGLSCVPVLAPLAGSVNNDNLGILAGGLLFFGGQRFLADRRSISLAIAGAGVALAGAAKLTALLLCGGFFILFIAIALRQRIVSPQQLLIAIAALALAAAAPLGLWLDYGSPAPNTPAQAQGLIDGAIQAGWADSDRLGPLAYFGTFSFMLLESWRPLMTDRTLAQTIMLAFPLLAGLIAAAGSALAARAFLRRRLPLDPAAVLVLSAAGAVAATLLIHVAFSYQRHLDTGWLMDAYSRYYLPLIAAAPLAALLVLRSLPSVGARKALAAFLVAGPILFGLFG